LSANNWVWVCWGELASSYIGFIVSIGQRCSLFSHLHKKISRATPMKLQKVKILDATVECSGCSIAISRISPSFMIAGVQIAK
jgi:hypothetical protein